MDPTIPPAPPAPGRSGPADHRALLLASPVAIVELDRVGTVHAWNTAAERLFGFPAAEVLGCPLPATVGRRSLGAHLPALLGRLERLTARRAPSTLSVRYRHPGGTVLRIELRLAPLYDDEGGIRGVAAVCADVTAARRRERALRHDGRLAAAGAVPPPAAPADPTAFVARLADALASGSPAGRCTGVLVIAVNSFWRGSALLGRDDADAVLALVGPRLAADAIRLTDTLARTGRDEFAVLLPGLDEAETATAAARRVLAALQRPFPLGEALVDLTVCLGVAVAPGDGTDAGTLFGRARAALAGADTSGSDIAVYRDGRAGAGPVPGGGPVSLLRQALRAGEITLQFQPMVTLATGEVCGAEALVRWQHPDRGLLPPGEFMPLIASSGLSDRLVDHVLDAALGQARAWADAGHPIPVSVNLAPRDVTDDALAERVAAALARHRLPAERLRLEVTEAAIVANPGPALAVLDRIAAAGVRLSLDDFGTGLSSINYLQRLPVTELKIDRSLVAGMADSPGDAALVGLAIELGHGLGLQVVAEGVEDDHAVRALRALGCDSAQGYHLGRPVSAAAFTRLLAARGRQPRAAETSSRA